MITALNSVRTAAVRLWRGGRRRLKGPLSRRAVPRSRFLLVRQQGARLERARNGHTHDTNTHSLIYCLISGIVKSN